MKAARQGFRLTPCSSPRGQSFHSHARLEGLNGVFQAARARARGYRNTATYITIIYLLAAPLRDLLKSI
jgi:hypothetical protein